MKITSVEKKKNNNSQAILLSLQNWQEGVAMVINTTRTQPVGRSQKHWRTSNISPFADDACLSYLDWGNLQDKLFI